MTPKVSVLIPSYNRPYETRRAVESVLKQSFPLLEIIIIDDNGEETPKQVKTENLLHDLIQKRFIKYIRHKHNYGGNVARNTGVSHSTGKYLALLDSDDEFYPEKIEKQVQYLDFLPQQTLVRAVTCNRDYFIGNKLLSTTNINGSGDFSTQLLLFETDLAAGSSILIDRSTLIEIGGFDPELKRHQEVEMLLRYLQNYELTVLSETLVAIHVDDRTNIPNSESFIYNKKIFLEKAKSALKKASPKQKSKILRLQNLEIAKVCIRNRDITKGIGFLIKSKPYPSELFLFLKESLQSALRHFRKKNKPKP